MLTSFNETQIPPLEEEHIVINRDISAHNTMNNTASGKQENESHYNMCICTFCLLLSECSISELNSSNDKWVPSV